jgi:hypothetical protein
MGTKIHPPLSPWLSSAHPKGLAFFEHIHYYCFKRHSQKTSTGVWACWIADSKSFKHSFVSFALPHVVPLTNQNLSFSENPEKLIGHDIAAFHGGFLLRMTLRVTL